MFNFRGEKTLKPSEATLGPKNCHEIQHLGDKVCHLGGYLMGKSQGSVEHQQVVCNFHGKCTTKKKLLWKLAGPFWVKNFPSMAQGLLRLHGIL